RARPATAAWRSGRTTWRQRCRRGRAVSARGSYEVCLLQRRRNGTAGWFRKREDLLNAHSRSLIGAPGARVKGAIAAGHHLTAEAGARALAEGGNAVDACVAAAFAAWVAESPLTGPGAGGFALVLPSDGRPARVADFFVATPGLGAAVPTGAEMHAIDVGFGGDSETTQVFRIGEASCAVPGAAAGLEAVHRAYGRLPWPLLLEPAIELARDGFPVSREQAHLHAILDLILRHQSEG